MGKLTVPGSKLVEGRRKHRREDCSATLVRASAQNQWADIVVTAWHCLEFYQDLSRPILFTLLPDSTAPITREAYRVADGGGMHADWALLKLYQPIASQDVPGLVPSDIALAKAARVTMAGYSGDAGLGAGGSVLTYHPACTITHWTDQAGESDCSAYKGASGGAVVSTLEGGQPAFTGVISRGDSESISIFVPVIDFGAALTRALR